MKKITLLLSTLFLITLFGCKSTPTTESKSIQQLIREGKFDEAKSFFITKTDINAQDEDGNTVLHIATAMNEPDLVTFLIIKGADTEIKNFNNQTPLVLGIMLDCYDSVRALVNMNANIFAKNSENKSVLELALAKNEVYFDLMITEKTAKLQDENGQSIIHHFVKTKNEKALSFAIKQNIFIDQKDFNGTTPLMIAFADFENLTSINMAVELLLKGAEPIGGETKYFEDAVLARNFSLPMDYGQTPLHIATTKNHIGIAKYLINNKAQISRQDINGSTPLHEACRYGNVEIAKALIDAKADVNAEDSLGNTPLLLIIPQEKRLEIYKLLIQSNADVNHKNMYGDTFLHTAAMTNLSNDILEIVCTPETDINIRNKKGNTALTTAVEYKLKKQIEFFVTHNADIHAENSDSKTPFTMILDLKNDELFRALINSENINSTDSKGNTPLIIAIQKKSPTTLIKFLISLGSDINARNKEGNSALYYAVTQNNKEIGNILLTQGADIFSANTQNISPLKMALTNSENDWLINSSTIIATDGSKNSVLHYAAEWRLTDATNFLIEKGAVIDAKNSNGETPLFNAAKSDSIEIIDTLLAKGANIATRDQLGSTAIHAAIRWNAQKSVKKLIDRGLNVNVQNTAGKTPLADAVLEGNFEMTKLLLEKGASPNIYDSTGSTSLFDAIKGDKEDVVSILLKNGANPQIQDMNGRTPFHEAANMGNVEIINMLTRANCNPLSRDKEGITPFSISFTKNAKVVRAVLGSDINITDSDGNTPVHIAVTSKASRPILNYLVKKGYPIDTRNSSGYTPLALAIMQNDALSANLLLEKGATPFAEINNKRDTILTIAFEQKNKDMLNSIVKFAAEKTDIRGNSILHYAAKLSDAEIIAGLLKAGAKKNVKNFDGESPYDLAIRWKNFQAAELLK